MPPPSWSPTPNSLWPQLPKWTQVVLSTDAWPADLVVPEEVRVPKRAAVALAGVDEHLHWHWELSEWPKLDGYVLRVWPYGSPTAHTDSRNGARLTVAAAWEFALTNSMPASLLRQIGLYCQGTHRRRRASYDPT